MLTLLVLGSLVVVLLIGVAAWRSRQRFQACGDAFRCRLRVRDQRSEIWPWLRRHWSRPMWSLWDEDVLIVRRGPVLARMIRLRTQTPVAGARNLYLDAPRLCGEQPIGVVLKIWDGSRIEVAASADDRLAVVGPFLAAAINDLPQAPVPRRHI